MRFNVSVQGLISMDMGDCQLERGVLWILH